MTVPSPCVDICMIAPGTGLCEGCARTIEEITAWPKLSDAEKQAIVEKVERRRSRREGVQ